jgi:addiction module HigA family antidote
MKYPNTMNKIKKSANEMIPGDIFHPGEFIKDELDARDLSQQALADKMKVSKSEISLLIHGNRNINVKTAILLEKVLGIDAEFWMNLQIKYDIDLVKKKAQKSIKQAKISTNKKEILKKLVVAA